MKVLRHNNRIVNNVPSSQILTYKKIITEQVIKTGYGALYNWWAIQQELVSGFSVPHTTDLIELITYLGGGPGNANGKLKSTRTAPDIAPRWDSPNTDATNEVNFGGVPTGNRSVNGSFFNLGTTLFLWAVNQATETHGQFRSLGLSNLSSGSAPKRSGYSVRCIRVEPLSLQEQSLSDGSFLSPVQDYDGNWYEVVKIGNQAWLSQNLRTTHWTDGTPIPNVTGNTEWEELETAAYCWRNNNIETPGIVYTDEFIELTL